MKLTKEKIDSIKDETILKIADALTELKKDENGFRRILFKFIREHQSELKKVDSYVYKRKFSRGYMKDLRSIWVSDIVRKIIVCKEAEKIVCKDCIVRANCSQTCVKFIEESTSKGVSLCIKQ